MSRHDFYAPIHKALRLALSNLTVRIGQTDFTDPAAAAATIGAVRTQMLISASHLRHEEDHIHGPLEARAGGATNALETAHRHHDETFEDIEAILSDLEIIPTASKPDMGHRLYLRFSQFVADDFAHMAHEELVTLPLLHRLFTDEELIGMEAAIIASQPPEKMMAILNLMLPAMNRTERVGFLSFARASAPPEAFNAVLQFAARPSLTPDDWRHLADGLGLAA